MHVGTTEILLDDALEFVNKCKSADVAATAKEFDGVLHGWHTFFPLMPVADAAVKEVADFLGPRLRGEPVDDVAVAPARVVAPPPPAAPAAAWTAAPPVAAPEEITQAEAVLTELDVRPTAADPAAAGGARPARPASAGGAAGAPVVGVPPRRRVKMRASASQTKKCSRLSNDDLTLHRVARKDVDGEWLCGDAGHQRRADDELVRARPS